MPYRTETETIRGKRYETTTLPSSQAKALLRDLTVLIGEAFVRQLAATPEDLESLKKKAGGDGAPPAVDKEQIIASFSSLLTRLEKAPIDDIFKRALSKTIVDNGQNVYSHLSDPAVYDEHFAGEFEEEVLAFVFALRVNFRFFTSAWKLLTPYVARYTTQSFQASATSESPSPIS